MFTVPAADQYTKKGQNYFRVHIPAHAKLASHSDGANLTYYPTVMDDLQLTQENLSELSPFRLGIVVRFVLELSRSKLKKQELIDVILQNMKLEGT